MSRREEIAYLEDAQSAASRRLEECVREIALTHDLDERRPEGEDGARRRRKLADRRERYEDLVIRLETEAGATRRARLEDIEGEDRPRLLALARKLHRRASRLAAAQERTREQYRGLRMRHLALEREIRELREELGEPPPEEDTPLEVRANLGELRERPEA
jgi:hypothetical protein